MAAKAAVIILGVALLHGASAYPGRASSCTKWQAGDPGPMGVTSMSDGATGGACVVDVSAIPEADGFTAGATYSVTVTSSSNKLYKLYSTDGQCLGDEVTGNNKAMSKAFGWVAPVEADGFSNVSFHALCSEGYGTMWVAAAVSRTSNFSVPVPSPSPPAPSPGPPAKSGGTVATASAIKPKQPEGVELAFAPDGEGRVRITVESRQENWVGVGFAQGKTVSMSSGGAGSDVVVCTEGVARRYWVTGMGLPADNQQVPGATCTLENGKMKLEFSRDLAAGAKEVAVTPGTAQLLLFARGAPGETAVSYHGTEARGGLEVDFATGTAKESQKRSAEAVLVMHFVLMALGWGGLLPFGVVVANRFRAAAPAWFKLHKYCQMAGWMIQLAGFACAIVYVANYSAFTVGLHVLVGFVVVILGSLQPLNAVLRPHATKPGEEKSPVRRVWEWLHKGVGYFTVVSGMLNMLLGVFMLNSKGYNKGAQVGAVIVIVFCAALPIVALVVSCACPDFGFRLLGGRSRKDPPTADANASPDIIGNLSG